MSSRRQFIRVKKTSRRAQKRQTTVFAFISSSSSTLVSFTSSTQEIFDFQSTSSSSHEEAIQQLVTSIDVEHRMRKLREKLRVLKEQHEFSFDSASNIISQTSTFASTNNISTQIFIAAEDDLSFASNNDNNSSSFLLLFQLFSTINKKHFFDI